MELALGLLCFAFAVQNLEETLFLPDWMRLHLQGVPVLTRGDFAIATLLLNLGLVGLCLWGLPMDGPFNRWALGLAAGALLANAATHIALSFATKSKMPGAMSGLALQGPAAGYVLYKLAFAPLEALGCILGGLALTPPVAAGSLWVARRLSRKRP